VPNPRARAFSLSWPFNRIEKAVHRQAGVWGTHRAVSGFFTPGVFFYIASLDTWYLKVHLRQAEESSRTRNISPQPTSAAMHTLQADISSVFISAFNVKTYSLRQLLVSSNGTPVADCEFSFRKNCAWTLI
jgi:hypothetical protein